MKKTLLALLLLAGAPLYATTRYVSSAGAGTTCTIGTPGPLTAATGATCAGHAAGDVYIMLAGTYNTTGITVTNSDGTAAQPVWLIADTSTGQCPKSNSSGCPVQVVNTSSSGNSITLYYTNNHFYTQGFEIYSSAVINSGRNTNSSGSSPDPVEIAYGYGIYTNNSGVAGQSVDLKFINMVIHDTKQNMSLWGMSTDGMESNGGLYFNSGWHAPDRGHGHGIYTQNRGVAQGVVKNNIVFGGAGQCIQFYGGDTAAVKNYDVEQNFWLNCNGRNAQYGGNMSPSMDSSTIINNESTGCDGTNTDCNAGGAGTNAGYYPYTHNFTNNIFRFNYEEGNVEVVDTLTGTTWNSNTWITNVNHGLSPGVAPGSADTWFRGTYGSVVPPKPASDRVKVYANGYVTGRCNVMAWNWDGNATVVIPSTDIASQNCLQNGDTYEIIDAQNPFGAPAASGTYTGGTNITVTVPTGASPPIPALGLTSTVNATNGAPGITKTALANFPNGGTIWNGVAVKIDGVSYTVSSVTNQTTLTLTSNYLGSTGSHTLTNTADGDLLAKTNWPQKGAFIIETTAAGGSTPTPTNTPTFTPTNTPIPPSNTPTNTYTPSNTPTPSNTQVAATNTPTQTFTPSNTPTLTATPAAISQTVFEAESCSVGSPMRIQSDASASGGSYVDSTVDGSTTPLNGGTLTCTVNIPSTGDWYVWARVLTANSSADSMYFELDSEGLTNATNIFDMSEAKQPCATAGCNYEFFIDDFASPSTTYYWNRLNRRDGSCNGFCAGGQHGTQRILTGLTAGTHNFKFYGREVGARLDKILLTTDPNYTATDITPTPTPYGGCTRRITCNGKSRRVPVPCGSSVGWRTNPCPWR